MWWEGNIGAPLVGMKICVVTVENSWEIPQKIKKKKKRTNMDPTIPLLGIYSKKMKTLIWKDICIPKFTAVFIDRWINKEDVRYTHRNKT